MKKGFILVLILVCFFLLTSNFADASGAPRRNSTKVENVFKPYTAEEWTVSPDEEPAGDHEVDNAPECDIMGAISCYDEDYLRVDIILENSISFDWDLLYGVVLEYDSMNEYFIYYTATKKLVYKKEKNGKFVETKELTYAGAVDSAGVTNSGDVDDANVFFIINKDKHIGGTKGNRYFLKTYFFSGFYNEKGEIKMADETIDVDLEFER